MKPRGQCTTVNESPPNGLKICRFFGLKRKASIFFYTRQHPREPRAQSGAAVTAGVTLLLRPPKLVSKQKILWSPHRGIEPGPPGWQADALPQSYGVLVDCKLIWTKLKLPCHPHSHTYLFESWLGSEESSISTISFDSLGDPFFLERNSVFLVPSGMNLIPRYALLHLASLGFRNGFALYQIQAFRHQKNRISPSKKWISQFVTTDSGKRTILTQSTVNEQLFHQMP